MIFASALIILLALAPTSSVSTPLDTLHVVSGFGERSDPITGRSTFHKGVDLRASRGATVRALQGGVVVFSDKYKGYGSLVVVSHGEGVTSHYAHLNTRFVGIGDRVERGTALGTVGNSGRSTGPHLHLEIRVNGRPIDPNPLL